MKNTQNLFPIQRSLKKMKSLIRFLFEIGCTKRPRMIYSGGWLNHSNLGDETLLLSYKRLFPNFGFLIYPKKDRLLKCLYSQFKPANIAVLAGGTLINRDLSYLEIFRECMEFCGKGFIFGNGVADPEFWKNRPGWKESLYDWKEIFEKCLYVGVRGPRSQEILYQTGFNVEIIGDPVLALAKDDLILSDEDSQKILLINVGTSFGNQWGCENTIIIEFSKLAKLANREGWIVKWIVVWPDDLDITQKVAYLSGTQECIIQIYNDPYAYMEIASKSRVFIGMKLHSVVLSVCTNTPSIMIEYRPKCRDFMRSIRQENLSFNAERINSGKIWELVKEIDAKRNNYCINIFNNIQLLKKKQLNRAMDITKNLI